MSQTLNQNTCPLCQQPNLCTANQNCWCMDKDIPQALIDQVSIDAKNKQCICQACVERFQNLVKDATTKR